MNTILGLPIHPMLVHLPIVLVPLLITSVVLFIFIPPFRQRIGWLIIVLSVLAPASVYGAIWSGTQLADYSNPDGWSQVITDHSAWGPKILWVLIAFAPVWWLFSILDRVRRNNVDNGVDIEDGEEGGAGEADPAGKGRMFISIILALAALVLLGFAGWWIYEAGHSGAEMIWGNTIREE